LTLLSYFLPFIFFLSTCTSELTSTDAFNKTDAILNEREKVSNRLSSFDTLFNKIDSNNISYVLTEVRARLKHFYSTSDNITHLNLDNQYRLLMPTDYSLSAIGTIWFHKNIIGKTAIAISLALSLIILLFYKVLDKRKIAIQIISANIIVLIVFIADNLLSNVTTLYGTWTLLFLLLIQLWTERRKFKTANR
jgi:hypothetical protein